MDSDPRRTAKFYGLATALSLGANAAWRKGFGDGT